MSVSYLTSLPLDFVRSMAGFHHAGQSDYYLPRVKIVPPKALVRSIWPWVNEWLAWFEGQGEAPAATVTSFEATMGEDRDDLAGQGFLRLLDHLRTIILQDSVIMQEQFFDHSIWNDLLFARDDYKIFAQELKTCSLDKEEPQEILLRRTLPVIADRLNVVQQNLKQTMIEWSSRTHQEVLGLCTTVNDLLSGRLAITLQASSLSSDANFVVVSAFASTSIAQSISTSAVASVSVFPVVSAAAAAALASPSLSSYEDNETVSRPSPPLVPPKYRLSRTIETVPDLWREWTIGLNSNFSVQSLKDTYGAAWRPALNERVFFSRRKAIIDEIRARQSAGINAAVAVEELELVRQRGKLSLHGLWKILNKNKKNNV